MTDRTDSAARVQKLATEYINRSGMSPVDFARRIGYAYSTVNLFLHGKYGQIAGDEAKITVAVLGFIERYPLDTDSLVAQNIYETQTVKVMRGVFARLLERPQVYLVYAPPGSGKTDIARHLIAQHNAQRSAEQKSFIFRVYCRARITPRDLLRRVAAACGTEGSTSIDRAIHNLRWDFRGARVVLYFDEAQHLSIDCFESVRELLDEDPRFSLCFAGSHELDKVFARFAGTLEQLERRISDKVTLPPVSADEAAGILKSELSGLTLDAALIRQQIELATISVRVDRKTQRYISIGRLMAAIREIREGMAAQSPAAEADADADAERIEAVA
jgi:DNA transposition AAA+ family ATPase